MNCPLLLSRVLQTPPSAQHAALRPQQPRGLAAAGRQGQATMEQHGVLQISERLGSIIADQTTLYVLMATRATCTSLDVGPNAFMAQASPGCA
jgi:hypothetical protein